MSRVLVVEDDPDISAVLDFNLKREGFDTYVASHGAKALRFLNERETDLVILDLMLPDIPGLDVCREIRSNTATKDLPIVMVTAKDQETDKLMGLECGADDYVVKPFSIRELLLRVRAVLRRTEPISKATPPRIESGPIAVDQAAHRVFINGEETPLTHTEYKLLVLFLKRPGRVFSREQLLDQVWNMPGNVVTRTVDTHVKRLREKMGPMGNAIETVRSVGYRFVPRKAT